MSLMMPFRLSNAAEATPSKSLRVTRRYCSGMGAPLCWERRLSLIAWRYQRSSGYCLTGDDAGRSVAANDMTTHDLGMNRRIPRRDFLNGVAVAVAGTVAGRALRGVDLAAQSREY